jgi:hypothetical protein
MKMDTLLRVANFQDLIADLTSTLGCAHNQKATFSGGFLFFNQYSMKPTSIAPHGCCAL